MKYYLDISLLPGTEISLGFLWEKVYQQIHIALAENKISENESAIGISFPKYGDKIFPLGDKLRLFSEEKPQLEQLDVKKWLNRLMDYTHVTSIKNVPLSVDKYACFKRKQFKSNLLKEAERRAKHKNESLEIALAHFKDYQKESSLPFINMTSLTIKEDTLNNKNFKLFIAKENLNKPVQGGFNCYGLSKKATTPWF